MFKLLKINICIIFSVVPLLVSYSCKKDDKQKSAEESILAGTTTILVDETIRSIIEDEIEVFESQYPAKITQINKSESEVVNTFLNDSVSRIAILTRKLTSQEEKGFQAKNLSPKITEFAYDAITFISNNSSKDTLVDLQEVINLIQGKPSNIKGLVFENPNSSTVRYMNELAGTKIDNKKGIYSLNSHEEVLKFVTENNGLIGVVGLNFIVQPTPTMGQYRDKFKVLAVRDVKSKAIDNKHYTPTQSNIGGGLYPLTRKIYMLNYQGKSGLGMGFASFIAGETGQRIVLKSGLLPIRLPGRIIQVRSNISK
ncbi:MAG TPA: substrate-binding domain-containing protein [Flavobacterium sp.]